MSYYHFQDNDAIKLIPPNLIVLKNSEYNNKEYTIQCRLNYCCMTTSSTLLIYSFVFLFPLSIVKLKTNILNPNKYGITINYRGDITDKHIVKVISFLITHFHTFKTLKRFCVRGTTKYSKYKNSFQLLKVFD